MAFLDAWFVTEDETFPEGRPWRRAVFDLPFDPYAQTPVILRAEAETIDATAADFD
ncbi:MAG: hypothetical protein AAGF84_09685 [Planctomycetota bacterium]